MKKVSYSGYQEYIDNHAHFWVLRPTDHWNRYDLVAIGLIGLDSSVRGMAAHIAKGHVIKEQLSRCNTGTELLAMKESYRLVHRPNGNITHSIVISKAAVDEQLEEGVGRVFLLPKGGDIAKLFLYRMANDFSLYYNPDWAEPIWNECRVRKYVRNLEVWADEGDQWENMVAFEYSPTFGEEEAKELVSEMIRKGQLIVPEGCTDAPHVESVLNFDADGEDKPNVSDYLQSYASHLATTIEEIAEPLHDIDRPINKSIALMQRTAFPAQAHTVQAILNAYEGGQKGAFCAADMGCGKSTIALATIKAMADEANRKGYGFACLLLVPGITIPKWVASEIKVMLPNAKITIFDDWKSVVKYYNNVVKKKRKAKLEFCLLSRDTAKLGMPYQVALQWKDHATTVVGREIVDGKVVAQGKAVDVGGAWICPDCGAIQTQTSQKATKAAKKAGKESGEAEALMELKIPFGMLAYSIDNDGINWKDISEYHCSSCNHNLIRHKVPERGEVKQLRNRRLEPAWFIGRYMRDYYDLLVVDELHQYKNASGQGEAMGKLVDACCKILGLTGTLSDGKASSLYHILKRVAPVDMLKDGMDQRSLNKFVHLYGTLEVKERYSQDEIGSAGVFAKRKVVKNTPKEVPGLSPKLFVNHLASRSTFLELGDMGLPLVSLKEEIKWISMDEEHNTAYKRFHNGLESMMKQAYACGNTGAFAKFIPSVVNAANQPHKSIVVQIDDDVEVFKAVHDESEYSAKERQLIADVKAEIAEGRRCMVFVRYSGDAEQDVRLTEILNAEGIKTRTLSSTVSPEDRVEWIDQATKKDTKCIVANAKLVEVGLDIMEYPTIIHYQFTDEVSTLRQSSRRHWRLLQSKACKVLYYVYEGTYEVVQLKRFLKKRSTAMLLEGRIDKSDLAMFVEEDKNTGSTYDIAKCLGNVEDLANKWQKLADKDIPQGVLLLEEREFKLEITKAMKRLAEETRRLAGVTEADLIAAFAPAETVEPVEQVVNKAIHDIETIDWGGLFGTVEEVHVDVDQSPMQTTCDTIEIVSDSEIRKRMGMVSKAKRVKKAQEVESAPIDQLAWAL